MTLAKSAEPADACKVETFGIAPASPHPTGPVLILCGAFAVFALAASSGVISTWESVRHYCEIPVYVGTDPQHIESALLRRLPVGASRAQVQEYLGRRGLGTDGHSVCSQFDGSTLTCNIPSHHRFWELIRESYTIWFDFDSNRRLRRVRVQSRLT